MAESNFPVRFFIDENFIECILKDKETTIDIFKKLNYVHTKSIQYPFCHNIIFDESFMSSIKDKQIRGQAILGVAHPITTPDFLRGEKDFYSKVIRYCISIGDKVPRKIYILTSEDKEKNYTTNPHYKDATVKQAIKIASGQSAIDLIDLVFNIQFLKL